MYIHVNKHKYKYKIDIFEGERARVVAAEGQREKRRES